MVRHDSPSPNRPACMSIGELYFMLAEIASSTDPRPSFDMSSPQACLTHGMESVDSYVQATATYSLDIWLTAAEQRRLDESGVTHNVGTLPYCARLLE